MKYLRISLVILLTLLLLSALTSWYVYHVATRTADEVAVLEPYNTEQLAAVESYWLRRAGAIDTLLRHEEHDRVTAALASLHGLMTEEAEFRSARDSLVATLRHIASTDLPLYYNLLTSLPKFCLVPA